MIKVTTWFRGGIPTPSLVSTDLLARCCGLWAARTMNSLMHRTGQLLNLSGSMMRAGMVPNRITLFNNAANGDYDPQKISHGAWIELDIPARQATLLTSYNHPQDLMATSQGNVQVLDTGNVLVGWGHSAAYTEFSREGDVLCDVHFGASAYFSFGRIVSYRVSKGDWAGNRTQCLTQRSPMTVSL